MYKIPEKYKKEVMIGKDNFINGVEGRRNKSRIRESLKEVKLKYQIDSDITNLIDDNYNIQVIMLLEVELKSPKYLDYVNEVFQKLIKAYIIIKYKYKDKVWLGYGYKRLSKTDSDSIVLEDSFLTNSYEEVFIFDDYNLYLDYLDFNAIKNTNNKLEFYIEVMVKSYLISNRKDFKNYKDMLDSNIYYSLKLTLELYSILKEIVAINSKLKNKKLTAEKIELNKYLVSLNKKMEGLLDARC